ncbi:MAG: Cysteine dioxygenase type [Rickettsiaceae bacterium]|jgi:hypothetical protein|nr:Cysteine dioxygenase type [Rickettsiaceae bacterium]
MTKFRGNVTYNEELTYEQVKEIFEHRGGEDTLKELGFTGDEPKAGTVERNTTHINLVKDHGYCLVEFDISTGAETPIHDHHHSCLSYVVDGVIGEVDYLPTKAEYAKAVGYAVRAAGNSTARITNEDKPFEIDPESKDAHRIVNFSDKPAKLYHIYPVSNKAVDEILGKIASGSELEKNEVEGLLRRDTNRNFYQNDPAYDDKWAEIKSKIQDDVSGKENKWADKFKVVPNWQAISLEGIPAGPFIS